MPSTLVVAQRKCLDSERPDLSESETYIGLNMKYGFLMLITILVLLSLTGCYQRSLTKEGAAIRSVKSSFKADNCQIIDMVTGLGVPISGPMKGFDEVKNQTAALGGKV